MGVDAGLDILARGKTALDVPVLTDVHSADQCAAVAEVVDPVEAVKKAEPKKAPKVEKKAEPKAVKKAPAKKVAKK